MHSGRRGRRLLGARRAPAAIERAEPAGLAELGRRWLVTYVATARNRKGQDLACARFVRYVLAWFGGGPIERIDGDGVREFRLWLERERGLSPGTVIHVLSDLRCLLRWAECSRYLERSPFPDRVMPRIVEVPPRGFNNAEVDRLQRVPDVHGFVLRFLLGTGLRWAEACRARPEDIQLGDEMLVVATTKSGRVRRVPLAPEMLADIAYWTTRFGPGTAIVPYAAGSPGSFARAVRHLSGIADFHVHRCRHTFAMRWLAAGGNLAVLQRILGHRDLATTMRYAQVTDALVHAEAARVAARQAPPPPE